jgi:hypothetical protein
MLRGALLKLVEDSLYPFDVAAPSVLYELEDEANFIGIVWRSLAHALTAAAFHLELEEPAFEELQHKIGAGGLFAKEPGANGFEDTIDR